MIRLRRLAIVLVAIGLVTSAIYATGAFSSLSTSRNANVAVVGDQAGYLGLTPGENGEYTTYQNGELKLRLSGALEGEDAPRGGGVNRDAETTIESVFIITNQGAQSVGVWLADTNDAIAFERESGASLEGKDNAVQLDPGDPVAVTVRIDTHNTQEEELLSSVTIHANSEISGQAERVGSSGRRDASGSTDPKEEQARDPEPAGQAENTKSNEDNDGILDDPIGFVDEEVLGDTDEKILGNIDKDTNTPQKEDVIVAFGGAAIIGSFAASFADPDDDGDILEATDLDGDGSNIVDDGKNSIDLLKKGRIAEAIGRNDLRPRKIGLPRPDLNTGDISGDGDTKDEKKKAKMIKEMIVGEVYPTPSAPNDPGYATTLNVVTTGSKYDIDDDGVKLYEEADDLWECGRFQCVDSEDTPGWDGPQFPSSNIPDNVMEK